MKITRFFHLKIFVFFFVVVVVEFSVYLNRRVFLINGTGIQYS